MPEMTPDTRLALAEDAIERLTRTQESLSDSLRKLVELEVRHVETREALGRAFKRLDEQDKQIASIQRQLPQLTETRGWVIAGVLGVLALLGVLAFKTIFGDAPRALAAPVATATR